MTKHNFRLISSGFCVDVRLRQIRGRWIASADTPDGPSLGPRVLALDAIAEALTPFERTADELLASVRTRGFRRGHERPTACALGERA